MIKQINKLLESSIEEGYFSGAVWSVYKEKGINLKGAVGYSSLVPEITPISENTIFDLASLTKPLITAPLVINVLQSGLLHLETPIVQAGIIPISQNIGEINIFQLLTHSSGIKAWYPLYTDQSHALRGTAIIGPDGKILYEKAPKMLDRYVVTIARLKTDAAPGEKVIYSCLGYILLTYLIQYKKRFNFKTEAKRQIIEQLGLKRTFFDVPENIKNECAAGENSNMYEREKAKNLKLNFDRWRNGIIRGEVNDCNAYYAESLTGNAGLFADISDTLKLAKQFLPGSRFFTSNELKLFYENYTGHLGTVHRSLAWCLASDKENTAHGILPDETISHSSFTGPALWINPSDREIYILFLNRLHPRRVEFTIDDLKREFLKLAVLL